MVQNEGVAIAPVDSLYGMRMHKGIVLERPDEPQVTFSEPASKGASWLLTGLFIVFVIGCLRYRKNSRFFSLLFQDVIEVRERHNAFDDTLRETTFIWLLNLLWIGSAGILIYGLLYHPSDGLSLSTTDMGRIGICIGLAGAYTLFLTMAYSVVGHLFSDPGKASMWVKGFLSSQGLESIILFPLALLGLCVPGILGTMLVIGGIVFIGAKLLFIYKGYCIFFSQFTAWVLFLYYLCSLEIVPIVLTYVSTRYLCSLV